RVCAGASCRRQTVRRAHPQPAAGVDAVWPGPEPCRRATARPRRYLPEPLGCGGPGPRHHLCRRKPVVSVQPGRRASGRLDGGGQASGHACRGACHRRPALARTIAAGAPDAAVVCGPAHCLERLRACRRDGRRRPPGVPGHLRGHYHLDSYHPAVDAVRRLIAQERCMHQSITLTLVDEAATEDLARRLAPLVQKGGRIHLNGDLGAGKTTFARALLRACGIKGRIKSPTFALVELYNISNIYCYHFDFYRFTDPREWLDAGFRDAMREDALVLIEWAEKA